MKKCIVRIDDVCPTMDAEQFNRALLLLNKYSVKPLLGVVPQNEDRELMIDEPDPEFWDMMKALQASGFTIAMHGCNHVYDSVHNGIITSHSPSEFAGHSYESQLKKIIKGKEQLLKKGIETDIFFAPGHSYDRNTLKALKKAGFNYISDGRSDKPYVQNGIVCIPAKSFSIPDTGGNGIFAAIIHPSEWTRPEKGKNYYKLEKWLESNKDFLTDFNSLEQEKKGRFIIQKIIEHYYIIWNCNLRPQLGKAKKNIRMFIYERKSCLKHKT